MLAIATKSLDEHATFLREYVRLNLWFLWTWLERHPEEDFREALRGRVDVFRKTDLNRGRSKNTPALGAEHFGQERWIQLENRACELYMRLRHESAGAFEHESWKLFRPFVEARVERDYLEGDGLDDYQCGSLRFHPPRRVVSYRLAAWLTQLRHGRPPRIFFHIGNAVAPRSIFSDRSYLPNCLLQMMREARSNYFAGALTTTTWLNSYPRWLALFPDEWHRNLAPPLEQVNWSHAWWGQFITGRGTFNAKHAEVLRRTGMFPYRPRFSWCRFEPLEAHLRQLLERGGDSRHAR